MASLTKSDLIAKVAAKTLITQVDSGKIINAMLDTIKESLSIGDDVRLMDFGVFSVQYRAPRDGRNPKTKQTIKIAARYRARFQPARALEKVLPKAEG